MFFNFFLFNKKISQCSLYCSGELFVFYLGTLKNKMAELNFEDSSNDSNDSEGNFGRNFDHLDESSCRWTSNLLDDLWTGERI